MKINVNKELLNFNWQVMQRILLTLYEHGPMKRTTIASKSGINYNNCMKYLNWLQEIMEFIKFEFDSDQKQIRSVTLTPKGMYFCRNKIVPRMSNLKKGKNAKDVLLT